MASVEFERLVAQLRSDVGEPYFAADGYILYCGDSLPLLRRLHQAGVTARLCLTSPPYNIGKEYEKPRPLPEYLQWCSEWMGAIHNIATPDGALWLNLGYVSVPGKAKAVPLPYMLWDRSPFFFNQEIVWTYGAGVSTKQTFCPRNEKWLYYVKDERNYVFNLDLVRDPNVKYPNQKKNGKLRCNPLGKNPSDVWSIPKVTTGRNRSSRERTPHPAQFPLAVVDRIVKVSSEPGDVVIDPFSGSGSAGIAAVGNARVFLGVEISERYCALAVERFRQYQRERAAGSAQTSLL
ncbi:DNA-methyltransferase [Anaeromyxobacter soli]|uniref:DNA-methyltransferase n=1 Tax=Anaeromyxobacter soli TaxID=2922725 RepID=UPI001FAFF18F|nr:site-specific DNA-methyltransferase [Anaeromyxobacter sp. SG29]